MNTRRNFLIARYRSSTGSAHVTNWRTAKQLALCQIVGMVRIGNETTAEKPLLVRSGLYLGDGGSPRIHAGELGIRAERLAQDYSPPALTAGLRLELLRTYRIYSHLL
jgi:hypothetical protein